MDEGEGGELAVSRSSRAKCYNNREEIEMPDYQNRITTSPDVLSGKPVIRGTRISAEQILARLSEGATVEALVGAWPHLSPEDVLAALAYSADVIAHEEMLVV